MCFTKRWLEESYVDVAKDLTLGAVIAMLDGITWDRVARTDTWLIRHLGVKDTPLHRAYGTRFLISMIARVRVPGCKVDTAPIFEGPQGQQKSMLLRALGGPWFTDHMPDLASKDAQLQLIGIWLVEFAEYGQLGAADTNRAKNFLTIQVDRLRRPYAAVVESWLRQCVMAVTLNPEAHGYLKDVTGNRRFWPMLCGAAWPAGQQLELDAFRRERDQLLAEADFRYQQGERWWLHEPALIAAHTTCVAERVNGGPLLGPVAKALQSLVEDGVTEPNYDQVCAKMGLVGAKDQTLPLYHQVGRTIRKLGWKRAEPRPDVPGTFYTFP
jgi:predicted P-loop ATPase